MNLSLQQFFILCLLFFAISGCSLEGKESVQKAIVDQFSGKAVVQHTDFQSMGPDRSDIYVIEKCDEKLLAKFVADWKLVETDEPSSAYDRPSTSWWPSHEARTALPKKFEKFEQVNKTFLSVWYEPAKSRVYIEAADW